MVIAIFGESCVGKSTLAQLLREKLGAEVVTGKDYLRMAKNEAIAKKLFQKKLCDSVNGDHVVYVITEREHMELLPEGAVRVLMTADLELIEQRFAHRMGGVLPPPVKAMLEKKHGSFDKEPCAFHIHNNENTDEVCGKISALANQNVL